MPTQKIITIPQRVIPAKEVTLLSYEIGMGGRARLMLTDFNADLQLSEDQLDRILTIILEAAAADEVLRDATIQDQAADEMPS